MDIEPKTINDICGDCGASAVGNAEKITCTSCGLETHNPTPAVEDLGNRCPHCPHPMHPEHDDFGCHIEGCGCTMTSASAADRIQDTLSNECSDEDKKKDDVENAEGFKAAAAAFDAHGKSCSTCDAECKKEHPDADKLCSEGQKLLYADIENVDSPMRGKCEWCKDTDAPKKKREDGSIVYQCGKCAEKIPLSNAEGNKTTAGKTIDQVSRDMTGKAYSALPDDGPEQDAVMRLFEEEGGVAQQAFQNADSDSIKTFEKNLAAHKSERETWNKSLADAEQIDDAKPEKKDMIERAKGEVADLDKKIAQGEASIKALKEKGNAADEEMHLSDKMMKDMMPLFVEAGKYPEDDHKCGNCNMRTPSGQCTVVEVEVDREKGTCTYWAGGESAKDDDLHEQRMKPDVAGYIIAQGKVQCGTCIHFKDDKCALWNGEVLAKECCISWSSGQEKLNRGKANQNASIFKVGDTVKSKGNNWKGRVLKVVPFQGGDDTVEVEWGSESFPPAGAITQEDPSGLEISNADIEPPIIDKDKSLDNVDIEPEHLDKDAANLEEIARHADGVEHEVAEMLEEDKSVYNAQVATANRREAVGSSKYGSGK